MEVDLTKVFITKYALTKGIKECEAIAAENMDVIVIPKNIGYVNPHDLYYYKGQWHKTKELAIKRAEEMRVKKIKSLKKYIKRLEKKKFE